MKSTLQKITDKARQIRRKGEKWTSAIKRASKMIPSLSPSKKKHSSRKVGAKKKVKRNRQTGTSSKHYDEMRTAKAPGKRLVRSRSGKSHYYTERRKNRSDKPGQLTGAGKNSDAYYRYNIMQRIQSSVRLLNEAEARKRVMQESLKKAPRTDKAVKVRIRSAIRDQSKYISTLKKDISGFKSLLR